MTDQKKENQEASNQLDEMTTISFRSCLMHYTILPLTKCLMRSQIQLPPNVLNSRIAFLRKIEESHFVQGLENLSLPWARAIIERDSENHRSEWITFKHNSHDVKLNLSTNNHLDESGYGRGQGSGILYFHGGAFLIGTPSLARPITVHLAEAVDKVFSVHYRKPPEDPFPAALEDAIQAYSKIVEQVGDRIILAGDSAGGGLALATFLTLQKNQKYHKLPLPIGLVLFSPWLDLSGETARSACDHDDEDALLPLECIPLIGGMYANGKLQIVDHAKLHPQNSPLHVDSLVDLKDLPPILIQFGQDEALAADAKKFAVLANADSNPHSKSNSPVVLDEIKGGWHTCQYFGRFIPESSQALDRANLFITNLVNEKNG